MPILQYIKGRDDGHKISDHFTVGEFNCPCDKCSTTLVDSELVEKLEHFRSLLGSSVRITSGYRCANKQQELKLRGYETAVGTSQHELGKAADLTNGVTPGFELEDIARKAKFRAVGVGSNWVHVDLRDDKDRRWTYKS